MHQLLHSRILSKAEYPMTDETDWKDEPGDNRQDFHAAVQSILTAEPRIRTGIGMQKEKSLHAILKNYIDPCPEHQEVPVGSFIADICDKDPDREFRRDEGKAGGFPSGVSRAPSSSDCTSENRLLD